MVIYSLATLSNITEVTSDKSKGLDKFWLIPFRSPLLRDSLLISFPQGTEMFQFPWSPPLQLCIHCRVMRHDSHWVPPFGNPRVKA